jgi:hypothetical protein
MIALTKLPQQFFSFTATIILIIARVSTACIMHFSQVVHGLPTDPDRRLVIAGWRGTHWRAAVHAVARVRGRHRRPGDRGRVRWRERWFALARFLLFYAMD